MKCLEEYFTEFLVYLNGFEVNGLKIYDLFKSLYTGEIELSNCYRDIAEKYMVLESILGDPRLALYNLAELVDYRELAVFLREYSDIVSTTGETKTLVEGFLKREFSRIQAKLSELMNIVNVIYEVVLVLVLSLSILSILPFFPASSTLGIILLVLAWSVEYIVSMSILSKLVVEPVFWRVLFDCIYILLGGLTIVFQRQWPFIHFAILTIVYFSTRPLNNYIISLEEESQRVLGEVYSRSILGEPVDLALIDSISRSHLVEYRVIRYGFLSGEQVWKYSGKLKLPLLPRKIIVLLTSLVGYTRLGENYVSIVARYVGEVVNLRRFINEKSRYYLFYSIVMVLLLALSYYIVLQIPGVVVEKEVLGVYGYLGVLLTSTPPCILRDTGLTSSKTFIVMSILGLAIHVFFIFI